MNRRLASYPLIAIATLAASVSGRLADLSASARYGVDAAALIISLSCLLVWSERLISVRPAVSRLRLQSEARGAIASEPGSRFFLDASRAPFRGLRRIFIAYTINRLGTWFGFIALTVAVYDRTHSTIAVAGLLLAGQVVPAFIVPGVVARVEGSPRPGTLSRLYFFEAVATGLLAALVWNFWLPGVLILTALDGTAALAASALLRAEVAYGAREGLDQNPAAAGASPEDRQELVLEAERRANATLNMAFSFAFVFGPVFGGLLVATAGAVTALIIDAVTFLVCGGLLLGLHQHVGEASGDSVRARLLAAWRHINEVPVLRRLLLAQAVALVFFESAGPVEIAYVKTSIHAGDVGYGLLVAAWGVGTVIGGIGFARVISRPLGLMLTAGTTAVGLAYVGFAAAPSLALACVAALVGGVGNGVQWASLISAVQGLTPDWLQSRVMGAVEALGAVSPAVGISLGGTFAVLASPREALLLGGLGAIATTLAFLRLLASSSRSRREWDNNPGSSRLSPSADPSPKELVGVARGY